MKTTAKKSRFPYQITLAWSAQDESWEARVPAIRYCLAYGDTPAEAVREVVTAAEAMLESFAAKGHPVPAADASLARVAALAPILNTSALAREAGVPVQTLKTKLSRGTALSDSESASLARVLTAHGIPAGA